MSAGSGGSTHSTDVCTWSASSCTPLYRCVARGYRMLALPGLLCLHRRTSTDACLRACAAAAGVNRRRFQGRNNVCLCLNKRWRRVGRARARARPRAARAARRARLFSCTCWRSSPTMPLPRHARRPRLLAHRRIEARRPTVGQRGQAPRRWTWEDEGGGNSGARGAFRCRRLTYCAGSRARARARPCGEAPVPAAAAACAKTSLVTHHPRPSASLAAVRCGRREATPRLARLEKPYPQVPGRTQHTARDAPHATR
jgi:hypothetical protein